MTDYAGLIERLESGSGADQELTYLLDCFIRWGPHSEWENAGGGYEQHKTTGDRRESGLWSRVTPNYLGSLDAALAFTEAVLPGWNITITRYPSSATNPGGWFVKSCEPNVPGGGGHDGGEAKTLARALLIATLRALQEQHND